MLENSFDDFGGCLLDPCDIAPRPERVYWASMRKMGRRQLEVSVSRPNPLFLTHGDGRKAGSPRQVHVKTDAEIERAKEDSRLRSIRKTRQSVRWAIKCLGADHMLTLTYRENMIDFEKLKSNFKEFVRLFRIRYPAFRWVAVHEYQERGALHLHLAVRGKQPVKWLLYCWLKAIGQSHDDLTRWYVHGVPLADKSLGAVNVRAPRTRWGSRVSDWRPDKLSAYLTKYMQKSFDSSPPGARRYWPAKGIEKPEIIKLWLKAQTFQEALSEVAVMLRENLAVDMIFFADYLTGTIWVPAFSLEDVPFRLRLPCPF